jgi:NADH:ubiquinone reductase (H+-translocating)
VATDSPSGGRRRQRIVILGSGFGGAYCAQHLERKLARDEVEVVLIDRHNYFIFYPLLVEAGTGSLQPRHAVVPIRSFLKRETFLMAEVLGVDMAAREVRVHLVNDDRPRTVPFDHLVLALGSVTNLPPVPGLKEFGYEMKSLTHAVALRDRAIQMLELASATAREQGDGNRERIRAMLHFVVVGGNFTGVEVAGEFQDYLSQAAHEYPGLDRNDIKVTLIDRNERILGVMESDELSDWAAEHMKRRGIELRLKESVNEIHPGHCVLRSGGTLATRTVIWCAGIAPSPLIKEMNLPHDKGWMLCERDGRVKGFDNLWGVGDCAVNPDANGKGYPATAQVAIGEGKGVARNLVRVVRGQPTQPIDLKDKGSLAAFGRFDAVAKVYGFRFTGFIAWFLWRTVYLMKMPGLGRKVRVAAEWTLDLVTGHDFAELGIHKLVRAVPVETARADAPRTEQPARPIAATEGTGESVAVAVAE